MINTEIFSISSNAATNLKRELTRRDYYETDWPIAWLQFSLIKKIKNENQNITN